MGQTTSVLKRWSVANLGFVFIPDALNSANDEYEQYDLLIPNNVLPLASHVASQPARNNPMFYYY